MENTCVSAKTCEFRWKNPPGKIRKGLARVILKGVKGGRFQKHKRRKSRSITDPLPF